MRRRVQNDIGLDSRKNLVQTGFVAHRAYVNFKQKRRAVLAYKLLLNIVGVVFIDIENRYFLRGELCYLTAKLRADRTAAARNKDGFSGVIFFGQGVVEGYAFTGQQIFNGQCAKLAFISLLSPFPSGKSYILTLQPACA